MTHRSATDRALVAIFVLLFAIATGFVVVHGTATALDDDLTHAAAADPRFAIDASWLWEQHNEHRIPLPRLVFTWLLHVSRDFRTATVVDLFLMASAAAGSMLVARRVRGRSSLADAFFPLVWLSLAHWETLLNGFQLVFVIPSVIVAAILATIASTDGLPSARRVAFVAALALALPLCGAPGVVQAIPVTAWIAWTWFAHRGRDGSSDRAARRVAVVGAACVLAHIGVYFLGLRVGHEHESSRPTAMIATAAQVLAGWTGHAAGVARPWSGAVAIGVVIAGSIACVVVARRDPGGRARALGALAIVAGVTGIALAIGRGRSGDGEAVGLASRYAVLAVAWPAALFFLAASMPSARWSRATQIALCACAACGWIASARSAVAAADARAMAASAIERRLAQGASYTEVADRRPDPSPVRRVYLVRALRDLDRAGVAPFHHASGKDPWLLLGRDPWTNAVRGPQHVLAGAAPVEQRVLDRIDAWLVTPGSEIAWDLPERITLVRGLCGSTDPESTHASAPTMSAQILDADGTVIASSRIEVASGSGLDVDGTFDFGLYAESAPGRRLVLRCDATDGAPEAPCFWAEVRMR